MAFDRFRLALTITVRLVKRDWLSYCAPVKCSIIAEIAEIKINVFHKLNIGLFIVYSL